MVLCYNKAMEKRLFARFLLLSSILISMGAVSAGAQGFFSGVSWFAEGSILLFPEKNGVDSDPMPILPSPGLGASLPLRNRLRLDITLDFYMTHYGYSDELGRAVPAAIENRSARVLGSLLAFQAAGYFELSPLLTLRAYGGPAADLRIVFMAAGLGPGDEEDASRQTKSARSYFWSSGRWFMPVAGAGLDFNINERFKLGIDLRCWIPAYRIWSGEDLPFIEGWRFGPGVRFTFR